MKRLKNLYERATGKIIMLMNNKDGFSDVLTMIVFGAIILIAVIASRGDITDIIDDNVVKLKNWVGSQVDKVLD